MTTQRPAPPGVDPHTPSPARIYDYVLGGTDNYASDHAIADPILAQAPALRDLARDNRTFLKRVVTHLVRDLGLQQILDIGSGLPTQDNVHQVAQAIAPATRVVYVDNDATVHAQAAALITGNQYVGYADADLRNPARILDAPATQALIDFTRPIGLLFVSMLQFVPDDEDPLGVVRYILDEMPSGSYLAIAHVTDHGIDPAVHAKIEQMYAGVPDRFLFRSKAQITKFFDGWDIVDPPGVTLVGDWTVHGDPPGPPRPMNAWCALARKPFTPGHL
ncbi:hypothetical protein GCM10017673_38780 [Streptosporangium violaceochromogenes]|nr:hypothetical protein GCM10017673_38780 [Streptosporangium violaceochromogenes]